MYNFAKLSVLLVLSSQLIACGLSPKESENLDTKEMYVEMEIENGTNDYTRIRVDLRKHGRAGNSIELTGGDRLVASFKDQSVILDKDKDFLDIDYEGKLLTQRQAGTITISLERGNGDIINSYIEMPEPFEITNPRRGYDYNEYETIEITWDNSQPSPLMDIHGRLGCHTIDDGFDREYETENENWSIEDFQYFEMPLDLFAGNLRSEISYFDDDEYVDTSKPCDFEIDLTRSREQDLSYIFDSGSYIRAKQIRVVDNMSVQLYDD